MRGEVGVQAGVDLVDDERGRLAKTPQHRGEERDPRLGPRRLVGEVEGVGASPMDEAHPLRRPARSEGFQLDPRLLNPPPQALGQGVVGVRRHGREHGLCRCKALFCVHPHPGQSLLIRVHDEIGNSHIGSPDEVNERLSIAAAVQKGRN
ncbi:MAG: hypothetical protein P8Z68_06435 [Kineosporiaceae bacterium]